MASLFLRVEYISFNETFAIAHKETEMPQIVHMQSERKYDGPGTPIHRLWTKWHGDPQFKTTTTQKQVTCKMCLRMLDKQSQK